MEFEWDPRKASDNFQKHGIPFTEAATVFGDTFSETVPDPEHSSGEARYLTVGRSNRRRLLIVAHTEREGRIRIISARELTRSERQAYEDGR